MTASMWGNSLKQPSEAAHVSMAPSCSLTLKSMRWDGSIVGENEISSAAVFDWPVDTLDYGIFRKLKHTCRQRSMRTFDLDVNRHLASSLNFYMQHFFSASDTPEVSNLQSYSSLFHSVDCWSFLSQANPPSYDRSEDLATLLYLNESSVMHCLRQRYGGNLNHTYAGPSMVVINPISAPSMYSEKVNTIHSCLPTQEFSGWFFLYLLSDDSAFCIVIYTILHVLDRNST